MIHNGNIRVFQELPTKRKAGVENDQRSESDRNQRRSQNLLQITLIRSDDQENHEAKPKGLCETYSFSLLLVSMVHGGIFWMLFASEFHFDDGTDAVCDPAPI